MHILVLDEDRAQRESTRRFLMQYVGTATLASNVAAAMASLGERRYDLVVADLGTLGLEWLELLCHLRDNHPGVGAILTTGDPSPASAFESARLGALAYLEKPLDPNELRGAVKAGVATVRRRLLVIPRASERFHPLGARWGLIAESPSMLAVLGKVSKIANSDADVLLQGETGVGKELVARAIHQESKRSSQPFVAINCAAISNSLLESELFGHVRGAFTGADRNHKGYFAQARGGTILLDEIGEMPIDLQPKLLRALDSRRIRAVGSERDESIDVRILAATNRNLAETIDNGFRRDLYHRIHVVRLEIPPLRDRGEDILLLVRHFLDAYAKRERLPPHHLTEAAVDALFRHSWPGNVRELKHLATELALTCEHDSAINVSDLPNEMRFHARVTTPLPDYNHEGLPGADRPLSELGRAHCRRVLAHFNGNKTQAARALRISRKRLRRLLDYKGREDGIPEC